MKMFFLLFLYDFFLILGFRFKFINSKNPQTQFLILKYLNFVVISCVRLFVRENLPISLSR